MGVLDRAKLIPGFGEQPTERPPYVCVGCEAELDLQYHRCPKCDSYDIRLAKWVVE